MIAWYDDPRWLSHWADWYDDPRYLAGFARWLSHHCLLDEGEDTHMFYEDPRAWLTSRLADDLHFEYEAERKTTP